MTAGESEALAGLITACVAQAARDLDEGVPADDLPRRLIEENVWRAVRFGLDGELIELPSANTFPAAACVERLLAWCEPMRSELAIDVSLPPLNGAQRQRKMLESGMSLQEVYADTVARTRETYAGSVEANR
jgi:carboxylate-amine ligase